MTVPHVSPTDAASTHDFALSDGTNTYGFLYARSPFDGYQESLLSGGSKIFKAEQKTFTSGRGKIDFSQDPNGYTDSKDAWTMTDQALFPTLQWKFARGLRDTCFSLPGPMSFQALTGSQLYVSQPFTTVGGYTAALTYLWVRKVGTPTAVLTVEICSQSGSDPSTVLATGTLAAATLTDVTTFFHQFATATALSATTTYHVKAYSTAGTTANHWEIGVDVDGATARQSAAGSTWAAATFSLYYRVTDADVSRKWHPFYMGGSWYVVSQNDASGASLLYINGDKGLATSASGTTIVTSTKSWTVDRWIGAKVRIVDGTGDGQVRTITDNDATSLTVSTWDITPDNTSVYVIYFTDWWTVITGHGLTALSGTPCVADGTVYFPQGDAIHIHKMTFSAGSHSFTDTETGKYDLLGLTTSTGGVAQIAGFVSGASTVAVAPTGTTPLVFATAKQMGGSDYRITGTVDYNGLLHAFKEDGMYRIQNAIPQEVIVGGLKSAPNISNGAYPCVQNLWLYFTRANSVVQEQGDNAADIENFRVGYEPLPVLRRGPGTLLSAEGWVFRTIDAGAGESSVLSWNGYGWHEVLRGYMSGARIRGAFWQPCPETRSRLWTDIGGDLVYQEFPQYGSNPLKDTNCTFQHEAVFITSTLDVSEANFYKLFKDIQVITKNLSAASTITVDYQLDNNVGTDTWVALSTALDSSPFHSANIEQGGVFQMRLRFRMLAASNTTPPILNSWTVNGSLIEPQKYQWAMTCTVESDGEDLQGGPATDPDTLDSWLKDCAARRIKLTTSSQKTSFHNKTVTVEAQTVRMASIDTEEGTSKWRGTLWFSVREA
jgi:ribosomal protein L31